jgi:hypothetical protein
MKDAVHSRKHDVFDDSQQGSEMSLGSLSAQYLGLNTHAHTHTHAHRHTRAHVKITVLAHMTLTPA